MPVVSFVETLPLAVLFGPPWPSCLANPVSVAFCIWEFSRCTGNASSIGYDIAHFGNRGSSYRDKSATQSLPNDGAPRALAQYTGIG